MFPLLMMIGLLGNQNTPKPSSYYIYPAHTQLQSELFPFRTDMMVFVNGTISTKNNPEELDIESLKLLEIEKKLRDKSKNLKNATFYLFCNEAIKNYQTAKVKLIQIGKEAGFSDSTVSLIIDNERRTWEECTMTFAKHPLSDEESENRIRDGKVKAFPVKTGLSKWVFYNTDLVVILPTLDKSEQTIPKNIIASIINLSGDKDSNQDKVIMFRFEDNTKSKNSEIKDQLIKLSKKMGFKNTIFQQY